ncbi:MAG: nitroreductase family protein [Niabella sp.]
MNLQEVLNFRRSVRKYDPEKELDWEKVRHCIELATLAPNSSNMHLWEVYHVTDQETLSKIAVACLNQSAAKTAHQIVVFVIRQDLYKKRAKQALEFEKGNVRRNSPLEKQEKRIKEWEVYYGKIMLLLYVRFFGIIGFARKTFALIVGLFRPMMRQLSENDYRVVVHKSCGLAAQTFMIAMANERYDTCPMEGFDSKRMKKILKLPYGTEINMVISCGIRKGNEGIWGERYRPPFDEFYHKI